MKYDYFCKKCNIEKEVEHGMTENPEIKCENCGELMKVKISSINGIHFKGQGFTKKNV